MKTLSIHYFVIFAKEILTSPKQKVNLAQPSYQIDNVGVGEEVFTPTSSCGESSGFSKDVPMSDPLSVVLPKGDSLTSKVDAAESPSLSKLVDNDLESLQDLMNEVLSTIGVDGRLPKNHNISSSSPSVVESGIPFVFNKKKDLVDFHSQAVRSNYCLSDNFVQRGLFRLFNNAQPSTVQTNRSKTTPIVENNTSSLYEISKERVGSTDLNTSFSFLQLFPSYVKTKCSAMYEMVRYHRYLSFHKEPVQSRRKIMSIEDFLDWIFSLFHYDWFLVSKFLITRGFSAVFIFWRFQYFMGTQTVPTRVSFVINLPSFIYSKICNFRASFKNYFSFHRPPTIQKL